MLIYIKARKLIKLSSRQGKAFVRYATIIQIVPLALSIVALLFVNEFTRPYTFFITPVNAFYFLTFLISGLILLLFELPFTKPELGSSRGGKLGTALVASFGVLSLFFGIIILLGFYDVTHDTGVANTILGFLVIPVQIGMFVLEASEVIFHQRRFALHRLLQG